MASGKVLVKSCLKLAVSIDWLCECHLYYQIHTISDWPFCVAKTKYLLLEIVSGPENREKLDIRHSFSLILV